VLPSRCSDVAAEMRRSESSCELPGCGGHANVLAISVVLPSIKCWKISEYNMRLIEQLTCYFTGISAQVDVREERASAMVAVEVEDQRSTFGNCGVPCLVLIKNKNYYTKNVENLDSTARAQKTG